MRNLIVLFAVFVFGVHVAWADSLYSEKTYRPLIVDHRGYRVGDILTVQIYESATASTSANTDTNRSADIGINGSDGTTDIDATLGTKNDFKGGGTSSQTGKLIASISVSVQSILENGDLMVSGEQLIELNNETQIISVQGRARPQDIASDNTILSPHLADAQIKFIGEGLLSGRSKPGLITRFFNWVF